MTRTLTGYIARETEAAVAFVQLPLIADHKPLWIPRKKIASLIERDEKGVNVQLAGETIQRIATPVAVEIDAAFLEKVGA
jgi:hypothetical protein